MKKEGEKKYIKKNIYKKLCCAFFLISTRFLCYNVGLFTLSFVHGVKVIFWFRNIEYIQTEYNNYVTYNTNQEYPKNIRIDTVYYELLKEGIPTNKQKSLMFVQQK